MSKRCDICGRGSEPSVSRSHSNIATKRRLYPNLQIKRIDGKKMKVCARCLRTMSKPSTKGVAVGGFRPCTSRFRSV